MTDPIPTEPVLTEIDASGVATVTLNRPAANNAYDAALIAALSAGLDRLRRDPALRLVVLRGAGRHFQAGADLRYLATLLENPAENVRFSDATVAAMRALDEFPCPIVAAVHGACFGGGVGLVASADVAIAAEDAQFALTEVRWGIVPVPILPQLIASIGRRNLRRYGLSGERFDAEEARRIGLVHETCPAAALAARTAAVVDAFLLAAPEATRHTKRLAREVHDDASGDDLYRRLARLAAELRVSPESREGLRSFAEKRPASWQKPA